MKTEPEMPLLLRLWTVLTRLFAPLICFWAKRMHMRQGLGEARFGERLGHASVRREEGRWIWIHAASLGEVSQIAKLAERLHKDSGVHVLVTTVTQSGAEWVTRMLPGAVHQYLPLDTPLTVNAFLNNWSPEMAVFVESDIWPGLVFEAHRRGIPLVLVNARPSKSRRRAPRSYRHLLSLFSAITCKSPQVLEEISALGVARGGLFHFGDLRASVPALPVDPTALAGIRAAVCDRPVWIAASSHADDEAEILTACRHVVSHHPGALLIWAPRHPQRASKIIAAAPDLRIRQRSGAQSILPGTQIYLADTLGEMGTLLSCSKIVFLGGSFGKEGGHNPFEPACFGCYIITGPNVQNHQEAFAELLAAGAAKMVTDGSGLGEAVVQGLATPGAANAGEKGRLLTAAADMSAMQTAALVLQRMAVS